MDKNINYWIAPGLPKGILDEEIATLIIDETCGFFELNPDLVMSKTRKRRFVSARHIAIFLIRQKTKLTLKGIARRLGGMDHTTVINAYRTTEDLCDVDFKYKTAVDMIKNSVEFKICSYA